MKNKQLAQRCIRFLASKTFFRLTLLVFVLQAAWIALSARYPQAFDEQFHFGIIRIYAHHLNPFLTSQPADAGQYGALARDPSYLYHYLMSFPYRLMSHLTASQTSQIIALRLINVAMLASSLVIFKKLLRKTPVSDAMANLVLAFIVLLPVFPLLGSQINYDNLFIPLSGLAIYWCVLFIETIRQKRRWEWDKLARLLVLCLLASLVKYPFLPIFLGIVICIGWAWLQARKRRLRYDVAANSRHRLVLAAYGLAVVLSFGLFFQRDGINVIKYYTPIPECNQVIGINQCEAYGPWARNYRIAQLHAHVSPVNDLTFPFVWSYHTMGELVFTISSSFNGRGGIDYSGGAQMIVVEILAWGIFAAGLVLCIRNARFLWGLPNARIFLIISLVYLLALFGQNFRDFTHLGQPLAIHGRYLFPILPLLFAMIAISFGRTIGSFRLLKANAPAWKSGLAVFCLIVLFFEGGGFVTYILRSQPSWFWPQSAPAKSINAHAKKILKPIVVDIKRKR